MNTAVKRMRSDIRDYLRSTSLKEQGIFCIFDDEDVLRVRAMLIGPEDTPYAYGFYFFDMQFPTDYPFKPPKVSYETRLGRTRFHPNLYASSKVCLSILGTWSGPSWTSAQTLSSVLLTIQSLLTKDPLTNEPGYEKSKAHTEKRHKNYETIVTYENYNIAMFRMMETPPNGFEAFLPIMQQCFVANADRIEKRLLQISKEEPTPSKMRCGVYNFESFVDYATCLGKFYSIKHQLIPQTKLSDATVPSSEAEVQIIDATVPSSEANLPVFSIPSTAPNKPSARLKKPKHKASEIDMQGTMVTVEQGNGKAPVQFVSRKCKQNDPSKSAKWQWRKMTTTSQPTNLSI